jgi:caffeoyl-CoA O-methyltransferase
VLFVPNSQPNFQIHTMEFLPEPINAYTEAHTMPESELLAQLNRETFEKVLQPRMLSGHLQGRVLAMLSKMIKPKYVLEIGTYTGYSALCFAEGLAPGGELHTIDVNEELTPMVDRYFRQSPHSAQLYIHVGKAMEIIPTLHLPWDLVFIDADKQNYSNYYNLLINHLPSGAFIIADNVLWSGKVVDPQNYKTDKDLHALVEFNAMVHADSRVENVLFPIRDGLMVVRKY